MKMTMQEVTKLTVNGEDVPIGQIEFRKRISLSRAEQMALSHQFRIRAERAMLFARMQGPVNPERIAQLKKAAECYAETSNQLEKLARTPLVDDK